MYVDAHKLINIFRKLSTLFRSDYAKEQTKLVARSDVDAINKAKSIELGTEMTCTRKKMPVKAFHNLCAHCSMLAKWKLILNKSETRLPRFKFCN